MPLPAPPRSFAQRKQDTLQRLNNDVDAWVATADRESGTPYMVPLSFLWIGATLVFATPASSPTARNLTSTGRVRIGIGPTRDVVLIEGAAESVAAGAMPDDVATAFAEKTGFDPRQESIPYLYFVIRPLRVQAWRESNELTGRDLMRDGQWLVEGLPA